MCLFKYKEKKYGKLSFILFALIFVAIAILCAVGGALAFKYITNWLKYFLLVIAIVIGLAFLIFGVFLIIISFSLSGRWKTVRDVNTTKGVKYVRLCDNCGKPISKVAKICEHCGSKQQSGLGMKVCPNCKTKNSALSNFCENCGYQFKED